MRIASRRGHVLSAGVQHDSLCARDGDLQNTLEPVLSSVVDHPPTITLSE